MPWMKVDDGFHDHPKVDDLPLEAVGLWLLCGTYCARHLTDGFVNARRVQKMGGTPEIVNALLESGLWDEAEGGYQFHDWKDYQPTKAKTEAEREANRERQRRYRRNSRGEYTGSADATNDESNAVTDDVTNDVSNTTPSRPVPSLINICAPATPNRENAKGATADEFDAWYAEYPRKRGKEAARKAFTKARRKASMEDLMEGLRQFNNATRNKDKEFLPYPATWLNAGQWEDDYSTPAEQEDYAWKIS